MQGRVRMITALDYTDWVYRPRRPEELRAALQNQAAHQVDIVRLLAGGRVRSVRALTGSWDPTRPTEGAYAGLLTFDNGAFATLAYSGYAHFDSDEFCGWVSEGGRRKDPGSYGAARRLLQRAGTAAEEEALKNERNYGGSEYAAQDSGSDPGPIANQHFGLVLVSCERADLRPLPTGVMIYEDYATRFEALPRPEVPRAEVIDELFDAVALDVMWPYVEGSIARDDFEAMVAEAYATFDHPEVCPVVGVGDLHLLELFWWPTLAFKDVALQLVGRLFDHELAARSQHATIVVATSGDTGSAAIDTTGFAPARRWSSPKSLTPAGAFLKANWPTCLTLFLPLNRPAKVPGWACRSRRTAATRRMSTRSCVAWRFDLLPPGRTPSRARENASGSTGIACSAISAEVVGSSIWTRWPRSPGTSPRATKPGARSSTRRCA